MYAWIFRHLPGPLWLRICSSVLLLVGALALLLQIVFPWLSGLTHLTDSTIGSGAGTGH